MKNPECIIIDYGMGNLYSIEKALSYVGGKGIITDDIKKIISAERLILPGVGSFSAAMKTLNEKGIPEAIHKFCATSRPLLGICLGMQLFLSESSEFGHCEGLNLIKGRVKRFSEPEPNGPQFKIPQIGWNQLKYPEKDKDQKWKGSVLEDQEENILVYFVHSFFAVPENSEDHLAETIYGNDRFCSAVKKDNITGCQFHPEKSGDIGLKMYKQFIS